MHNYIIFALVVIVLVVIIYYFATRNSDKERRKRAEKYYHKSAGNFDENARRALDELMHINEPNPQDLFRRANLIEYNISEGNIRERYPDNNNRRMAIGAIANDYRDTINLLRGQHVEFTDFNPEFMIHHIENFGERLPNIDDTNIFDIIVELNDFVDNTTPEVRREIINERKQNAIASADTKTEAIDNYFEDAIKYTSDAQNVHDSKVNIDLRKTLAKLKNTSTISPSDAIKDADNFIRNEYARDPDNAAKVADALQILDIVSNGGTITTYNDKEDNIFAAVWDRCSHRRNATNSQLMKEAVVNALADGMENNNPVCINGRCARILNSLATLDYDKEISERGALTFEAYKNQIFQESQQILHDSIERAKISPDDELRAVGLSFETNVNVNPAVETQFKNDIKKEIDINMRQYVDKLSEKELSQIREECYAAID